MPFGIPIDRQLLSVLEDGTVLLDWGDGTGIDLANNEFIRVVKKTVLQAVQDDDLEALRRMGRIISFDHLRIYVPSLPERPAQE